MPHGFLDIAATPSVKAAQTANGVRALWEALDADRALDRFTGADLDRPWEDAMGGSQPIDPHLAGPFAPVRGQEDFDLRACADAAPGDGAVRRVDREGGSR